jgi:hypothetical protein
MAAARLDRHAFARLGPRSQPPVAVERLQRRCRLLDAISLATSLKRTHA